LIAVAERYASAFAVSSGITFGLFWSMTLLIRVDEEPPPEIEWTVVEIVDVMRDSPIERIRRKPPPRRPVLDEPKTRRLDPEDTLPSSEGIPIPLHSPADGGLFVDRHLEFVAADANATAIVRVPPRYPEAASRRGLEGRVLVEFSIGRSGTVFDAQVIAAEPERIFDDAALDAVRQWRYEPKIVDGEAVEQHGLRIAIPFRLEDEGR
jgi:protein TonB